VCGWLSFIMTGILNSLKGIDPFIQKPLIVLFGALSIGLTLTGVLGTYNSLEEKIMGQLIITDWYGAILLTLYTILIISLTQYRIYYNEWRREENE